MTWPQDAYVGQKVARYRNGRRPELRTNRPLIGEPVTIASIELDVNNNICFTIIEYPIGLFNASVFRPIEERPTDISIFTAMLGPRVKEPTNAH